MGFENGPLLASTVHGRLRRADMISSGGKGDPGLPFAVVGDREVVNDPAVFKSFLPEIGWKSALGARACLKVEEGGFEHIEDKVGAAVT